MTGGNQPVRECWSDDAQPSDSIARLVNNVGSLGRKNESTPIQLAKFRDTVRHRLSEFDIKGSGELDAEEIAVALEKLVLQEVRSRHYRWFAKVAFAAAFLTILANAAMTFTIVSLWNDATIVGDILTSRKTSEPVQTGNLDITVNNGLLVARSDGSVTGPVLATKAAPLEPEMFHSFMPDDVLDQLKVLKVSSHEAGAKLTLVVLGWARVPSRNSIGGYYIKLVTQPGTIRIDASVLSFDDVVGSLFQEAGFTTDGSGRRLQGVYELVGLFNSIPRDMWGNLGADEIRPGFDMDFYMEYTTRYPCSNDVHKCLTGHANNTLDSVDNDGYVSIFTTAFRDEEMDAVLETVTNAEWPRDKLVTFDSASLGVSVQRHDGLFYFCDVEDRGSKVNNTSGDRPAQKSASLGWDVKRAIKVAETLLPDGTMQREFKVDLAIDHLSYALLMDDPVGNGYTGTITVTYFDDKATGNPRRIVYSNGIEVLVSKFLPQPVDLSHWKAPQCSGDGEDVPRMSASPYIPNYARRAEAERTAACGPDMDEDQCSLLTMPPTLMEALLQANEAGNNRTGELPRRRLAQMSLPGKAQAISSCSPRGSCAGSMQVNTYPFSLTKAFQFSVQQWANGCGIKQVSSTTQCGGFMSCYGSCSGENSLLCGSRNDMTCGLKLSASFGNLLGDNWLLKALSSYLDVQASLSISYQSSSQQVMLQGLGSIRALSSGFWGSYGGVVTLEGGGSIALKRRYFEVYIILSGRACFVTCKTASWVIFSKTSYY